MHPRAKFIKSPLSGAYSEKYLLTLIFCARKIRARSPYSVLGLPSAFSPRWARVRKFRAGGARNFQPCRLKNNDVDFECFN